MFPSPPIMFATTSHSLSHVLDTALKAFLLSLIVIVGTGLISLVNMFIIMPLSDPLSKLPGPRGGALQNHFRQLMDPAMSSETHSEWKKRYGKTFRFHGFGKHDYRLMSFDFRVISHVLSSPVFEKPWQTRAFLGRLIGRGIFSMEGHEHRMQRRIIAPAFTVLAIKNLTPIFSQKADELCNRWRNLISESCREQPTRVHGGSTVIDIAHWISRASFDVMGLSGFDYDFNSLRDESEEVYSAYRRMFNIADKGFSLRDLLELFFPILRKFWLNDDIRATNASLNVISQAGKKIVAKKKMIIEKSTTKGRTEKDILSLLIKSNLSLDPSNRLSDAELLDQCSTMLLAGSDTVSTALSWCFHALSHNPDVQTRLRDEILQHLPCGDGAFSDSSSDSGFYEDSSRLPESEWIDGLPTSKSLIDIVNGMPFLDCVVRETLRFCPPVHATIRVAMADEQIPVSHTITLPTGETIEKGECIAIRKGSYVHIPIEGLSYSEEIWGSDALEFNPDRWEGLQNRAPTKPGVGNLMTFGYGPHSCLGYRFSIAEMKIFLVSLLPHFEFSPVEDIKIGKINSLLTRPYVKGQWEAGTQLPTVVRELK